MPKIISLLLATVVCSLGWVAGASATNCTSTSTTCTITNTTLVQAANIGSGTADTSFFGNSSGWGNNVGGQGGGDYSTTGLTATYTAGANGTGTVTFVFTTTLSQTVTTTNGNQGTPGQQAFEGREVSAADIFIQSGPGSSVNSTFNYGIALGYTAAASNAVDNGAAIGLYKTPTFQTSDAVWGFSGAGTGEYGGAFTDSTSSSGVCATSTTENCAPPTVLTGGTDLTTGTNDTVCTGLNPTGTGCTSADGFNASANTFTVAITGTNASLAIFSDFNIFWGTGDCSNAPIYGNIVLDIPPSTVPEPSSLALLATAGFGLEVLRRRKRKGVV